MTKPDGKAVTQTILPTSRGSVNAVHFIVFRKGDQEVLALHNSTLRLLFGGKRKTGNARQDDENISL
jgi:hypothetical protein